jgi:hypothetical protein
MPADDWPHGAGQLVKERVVFEVFRDLLIILVEVSARFQIPPHESNKYISLKLISFIRNMLLAEKLLAQKLVLGISVS